MVRISNSSNSWIGVENLELVEEENKVYTEKDIYEGMVLECVDCITSIWRIGKQYVVDKNLCVYDEDNEKRDITQIVNRLNNPNERVLKFKVVEPIVKDNSSNFTGVQIETPVMSSNQLVDNNMVVDQEHYTNNDIQPIEIMKANFTIDEYRGFLLGNIVKYPLRYKDKNGLRDLKTTYTYLTWLIQDIEERGL